MPKFKFEKLVRDKIVDHQIALGGKPKYRELSSDAHKQELVNKIVEEAREIANAPADELASEIADVQQALDDLKELCGISGHDVAKAQAVKNDKNGAFKKGLFVEHVEVDENNEWIAYYRQNADRYPEIR